MANEPQVREIAAVAVRAFGGFDTWVNNAGVSIYGRLLEVSMEDQRQLFETNYWGLVHGCRAAADHLRQRGGALINIGSVLSDRAIPLQGAYCASKHAVKGYTDALRMELAEEGAPVQVTLIKPSAIDTPYKDHAKNYLPVAPKNPPPVYAPEAVAEAILHCAEHPEREMYIGGGGRALAALGRLVPWLTDKAMEKSMFQLQKTSRPRHDEHGLDKPAGALQERGGYEGHVAETSAYTKASLHPWAAGVVGVGVLMGAAALAFRRR
jgi:short-subunit dehydrogenase